jgi:hypothetical protein
MEGGDCLDVLLHSTGHASPHSMPMPGRVHPLLPHARGGRARIILEALGRGGGLLLRALGGLLGLLLCRLERAREHARAHAACELEALHRAGVPLPPRGVLASRPQQAA